MAPSASGVATAIEKKMPVNQTDSIVGLNINQHYSIGSFLGEGAFGKVYAIHSHRDGKNTEWAVKIVPNTSLASTKSSKKKTSNASTPADRLHFEYLMYTQQLRPLCGTIIPNLPSNFLNQLNSFYLSIPSKISITDTTNNKNSGGTTGGYRCLIVEQMKCELLNILPSFVEHQVSSAQRQSGKEIALGPVCTQLIRMVEAVHKTKHILLDVKPDNLMIDYKFTLPVINKSKTNMITTDNLAKSMRLVDFGLLKPIGGVTGTHMENAPTSEVQGTPLYASLHVHNLQTPSRRDDLYAMLYVIGDVVLNINGILYNKPAPYGAGTKAASYFPWSQCTSDVAIGQVKVAEMASIKSHYFASMPNPSIAEALFCAHQQVHDTEFAQVPDYNSLCELLNTIKIPIPVVTTATTLSTTSESKKRNSRLLRSTCDIASEDVTTSRPTSRPSKMSKVASLEQMDISSDSDDVTMHDAVQGDPENESDVIIPAHHRRATTNPFLILKVTSPQSMKDTKYVLEQGISDSFTIGSGELPGKSQSGWLFFDPVIHQIEPKHASVRLVVQKRGTLMIEVHDFKSTTGTFVSNKRIPSGKKQMVFCNHTIRMGNIEFIVVDKM